MMETEGISIRTHSVRPKPMSRNETPRPSFKLEEENDAFVSVLLGFQEIIAATPPLYEDNGARNQNGNHMKLLKH